MDVVRLVRERWVRRASFYRVQAHILGVTQLNESLSTLHRFLPLSSPPTPTQPHTHKTHKHTQHTHTLPLLLPPNATPTPLATHLIAEHHPHKSRVGHNQPNQFHHVTRELKPIHLSGLPFGPCPDAYPRLPHAPRSLSNCSQQQSQEHVCVRGLGFRIYGLWLRVYGSGFRVPGSGFEGVSSVSSIPMSFDRTHLVPRPETRNPKQALLFPPHTRLLLCHHSSCNK